MWFYDEAPFKYNLSRQLDIYFMKLYYNSSTFGKDALELKNAVGGKNNATSLEQIDCVSTNNFLEGMIYFDVSDLPLSEDTHLDVI